MVARDPYFLADRIVEAIEAFVQVKIEYDRARRSDPEWVNRHDVDETREHLRNKLMEVLK